jgi:hypothetical protein
MDKISKNMTQVDMTIQMRNQGVEKKIMGMEVHRDGNGKLWLKFSMNIVKPMFIHVAFHYKFSSSIGSVYKEEKGYVSCKFSRRFVVCDEIVKIRCFTC